MRFNSVRTGNYSQSAKAVVRASDQIFDAAMSGKPDFTKISKEAIKGRSLERRAVTQAEGNVAQAGITATETAKKGLDNADVTRDYGKKKAGQMRMAGFLGAAGSLAGGYVLGEGNKKDKAAHDEYLKKFDERTQAINDRLSQPYPTPEEIPDAIKFTPPKLKSFDQPSGNGEGGDSKPSKQPQTPGITDLSSQSVSGSYDLSSLTPQNWQTLSRAVSGEAGPGDDRYGVVASILNRVSSDKFPGTIRDVVYQNDGKGTYQYEAFTKGTDFNDPKLTADLSSKEGQAKILKALSVLDGRTDFKGQTMLKYRSSKGNKNGMLDPMFHPKGNFYHYAHQT